MFLETYLFPIIKELTGVDLSSALELVESLVDVPDLGGLLGFLTRDSALNPARLTGNLWPLGVFPDADSIAGQGIWGFDPTVTRTADSSGSVKVVANGQMKALRGVPTAVVAGQEMSVSVFVRWSGYSGTQTPIQLHIAEYFRVGDTSTFVRIVQVDSVGPSAPDSGGWVELTGTYTAPADGSVNEVRGRLVVTEKAAAGTIWFDDAAARAKLLAEWVSGLPEGLQNVLGHVQALIDTLYGTLTGSTDFGHTLPELVEALKAIPNDFVRGLLGPGTLGESVAKLVDAIVSGAVGESGSGATFADIEQFIAQVSSWATQGRLSWDQLGIRNNRPVDAGLLPSERSNFNLSQITTQHSVATATSLIAFDYIEESMPVGVVSWIGWGVSGITEFYVNIYKVDLEAGGRADLVHASPNVVGVLSGTASPGAFQSYELADPVAATAADLLAYEFITVGGTHTIRGRTYAEPQHPSAPIGKPAAARTVATLGVAPSEIAWTDIAWSGNVPWVGIAVDTGNSSDHHDPQLVTLTGPGTLPVANWADFVDVVVLGEGGDGAPGFLGLYGNPGQPGAFNKVTWARGTHFTGTSTVIEFDASTVEIPGYAVTALNGANGSGQRPAVLGKPVGSGPGTVEYNGIRAIGGSDQFSEGGDGAGPGAAGAGGSWFGLYQGGGQGGPPRAWVQFRKDALPGETPGSGAGDTTPPNIDDLAVVVETGSTAFTLTIEGAVDE